MFFVTKSFHDREIAARDERIAKRDVDIAADAARIRNLDNMATTGRLKIEKAKGALKEIAGMETPRAAAAAKRMALAARKGLDVLE